jgi:MFS family permease
VKIFASLNRQQREAVGLLQIGTFLEYFDLMLYVHMAVLLNELFFPATDPHTASLITALAFCATFVFRPFGALIFGYMGDHIGRKSTVVITTMIMSISCLVMANLPTYAEIGITASWIVTICRIVQGMTSMGEIMGAEIYVSEMVKPPAQYYCVSLVSIAATVGGLVALGIATLVTTKGFNWRIGFWIGTIIAIVGTIARRQLRETPDFANAKKRMQHSIEESNHEGLKNITKILKETSALFKEKINKKTALACVLAYCGWPLTFYLGFIYFNPLLKSRFGYSSEDVIKHNFFLSLFPVVAGIVYARLSQKIAPLKILKTKAWILFVFALALPFFVTYAQNHFEIFAVQAFILTISLGCLPADSILISHFPILKRFTAVSFIYALSRAFMYIITSFSLVYMTEMFGYYGIWTIMMPVIFAHLWGVNHFQKLENKSYAL